MGACNPTQEDSPRELIPCWRLKRANCMSENHTLSSGTSPYGKNAAAHRSLSRWEVSRHSQARLWFRGYFFPKSCVTWTDRIVKILRELRKCLWRRSSLCLSSSVLMSRPPNIEVVSAAKLKFYHVTGLCPFIYRGTKFALHQVEAQRQMKSCPQPKLQICRKICTNHTGVRWRSLLPMLPYPPQLFLSPLPLRLRLPRAQTCFVGGKPAVWAAAETESVRIDSTETDTSYWTRTGTLSTIQWDTVGAEPKIR